MIGNTTTKFSLSDTRMVELDEYIRGDTNKIPYWIKFTYIADEFSKRVLNCRYKQNSTQLVQINSIKIPEDPMQYLQYRNCYDIEGMMIYCMSDESHFILPKSLIRKCKIQSGVVFDSEKIDTKLLNAIDTKDQNTIQSCIIEICKHLIRCNDLSTIEFQMHQETIKHINSNQDLKIKEEMIGKLAEKLGDSDEVKNWIIKQCNDLVEPIRKLSTNSCSDYLKYILGYTDEKIEYGLRRMK